MDTRRPLSALAVLALAAVARADVVSHCPSDADNVCFGLGVPSTTAAAGSGNIYFSITAPTSYEWVALGTGNRMAGSNIFVMYQDGNGNVTVSPRLGTGYVMPQHDTSSGAAQLTVLAGSGVTGNTMTAYVQCANCQSWGSSGQLSMTSSSAPWIAAWKRGSPLATTNAAAPISVHDGYTQYDVDLSQATIASDSNPFIASTGTGTGTGSDSGSGTGSDTSGPAPDTDSGSGVVVTAAPRAAIVTAHAVVLAIVMVILYPLGSAVMPLLGQWLLHGAWQGLAYLLMWAGFALGVIAAKQRGMLFVGEARTHTVFGTVVVAAMGLQPLLGVMHHRHFVQHQGRGLVSHIHIWWGRLLMVLGVVNGGLGLKLASASTSLIIAYSVVAGVVFVAYAAAKVAGTYWLGPQRAKRNQRQQLDGPEMAMGTPRLATNTKANRTAAHSSQDDSGSASINDHSYSSGSPVLPQSVPATGGAQSSDREQRYQ